MTTPKKPPPLVPNGAKPPGTPPVPTAPPPPEGSIQQVKALGVPGAGWKSLGMTTGFDPSPVWQLRMILIGPMGVGKSTFVSTIPDALVIDLDRAHHAIPQGLSPRIVPGHKGTQVVDPWVHLQEIVETITTTKNLPFRTVIIDTIDRMIDLVARGLTDELNEKVKPTGKHYDSIKDYGQRGAGWSRIHDKTSEILQAFEDAGLGTVVVGHMKTETAETSGGGKISYPDFAVSDGTAIRLKRQADYVGQILKLEEPVRRIKIFKDKKGNEKELPFTTQETIHQIKFALPTISKDLGTLDVVKHRIEIPDRLTFDRTGGWDTFAKAYETACEREKSKPLSDKETPCPEPS